MYQYWYILIIFKEEDQGTDTQAPTDQEAPTPQNEVEPPPAATQVKNNACYNTCMCIVSLFIYFQESVIPKFCWEENSSDTYLLL